MIQILVPQKRSGGVYDYSSTLQEALGGDVAGLVPLSKANAVDWKAGHGDPVILQMSGYGFAKRGAPLWLLRELEQRRGRIGALGIFFHELYASGPPWSSSFWLSPVQRYISRRLGELSDFWMTSQECSAQWLRQYADDKPHAVLPVFSNVGELVELREPRLPRIVVFGSPELRQASYQSAGGRFFVWAREAALEIHDIGAPVLDTRLAEVLQLNGVVQHGRLSGHEVSGLMGNALFGLLAYPAEFVAKSGVFAAYCAHAVCTMLMSNHHAKADGLAADAHYLAGIPEAGIMTKAEAIGRSAWEWYRPHGIANHVKTLNRLVQGAKAKAPASHTG